MFILRTVALKIINCSYSAYYKWCVWKQIKDDVIDIHNIKIVVEIYKHYYF